MPTDPWVLPFAPCEHTRTFLRHYPATGGYSDTGESIITPAHDVKVCQNCLAIVGESTPCKDPASHYKLP